MQECSISTQMISTCCRVFSCLLLKHQIPSLKKVNKMTCWGESPDSRKPVSLFFSISWGCISHTHLCALCIWHLEAVWQVEKTLNVPDHSALIHIIIINVASACFLYSFIFASFFFLLFKVCFCVNAALKLDCIDGYHQKLYVPNKTFFCL